MLREPQGRGYGPVLHVDGPAWPWHSQANILLETNQHQAPCRALMMHIMVCLCFQELACTQHLFTMHPLLVSAFIPKAEQAGGIRVQVPNKGTNRVLGIGSKHYTLNKGYKSVQNLA